MIIGTNTSSTLRKAPLSGLPCPYCGAVGTLRVKVRGSYVHIAAIPLFPLGKSAKLHCKHCRKGWDAGFIPLELQPAVAAVRQQTRTPFRHWLGLVLLAGLFTWGIVNGTRDDREDLTYLAAPQAGDVYTIYLKDNGHYSLLKVVRADSGRVALVRNRFETTESLPLHDLNYPDRYDTAAFSRPRAEVQRMYREQELTEIDRPAR